LPDIITIFMKGLNMVQNELNIIVCIKSMIYNVSKAHLNKSEALYSFNSFNHTALEYGFRLRGEFGGRVDVLSIGPMSSMKVMREVLAMGADRAVLLSDPALADSNALNTIAALSAAIRSMAPYDLVLFGTDKGDRTCDRIGSQTARMLNLPFITGVERIVLRPNELRGYRSADGQITETFETRFPAALTIHPHIFKVRDEELFGITAAFEDLEVDVYSLADLGLKAKSVHTCH
jgi:electron transfer flavoprotein beta subunit